MSYDLASGTLIDTVIERLKELIVSNRLRPGDSLPTENALAERFGVSRISIREALRSLRYVGILSSARKRGLRIAQVDMARLSSCLEFQMAISGYPDEQLLRARSVIELGILPHVAQAMVRDPGLYDRLYALTERPNLTSDPDQYIHADIEFHSELVKAAGIEPLAAFSDLLHTFFRRFRARASGPEREGRIRGIRWHRRILAALRDGQVAIAQDLMRHAFEFYRRPSPSADQPIHPADDLARQESQDRC